MINHEYAPVSHQTREEVNAAMLWAVEHRDTRARQVAAVASRVQRSLENQGWKPPEAHKTVVAKLKADKDRWHSAWASVTLQHEKYVQQVQKTVQAMWDAGDNHPDGTKELAKSLGVLLYGPDGMPIYD